MKEKFPVPQADAVVGKKELNPEYVKSSFEEFLNSDGSPVTDPEEVLRRVFEAGASEFYKDYEISKSEKDLEIIKHAEDAVREYAVIYGRNTFSEFSTDHIHLFEQGGVGKFTDGRLETGSHSTVIGEVIIERRSDLETAITAFHELWHMLGSYHAIQVTSGEDKKLDWYRSGIGMKSRDGMREWFNYFDEALTGYMTKKYVNEKLKNSQLFRSEIEEHVTNNVHIDTTREQEVSDLKKIVDTIFQRNQEKFSKSQDVMDMFVQAQVTGNVLLVAKLVEGTFGKGAFRRLGSI